MHPLQPPQSTICLVIHSSLYSDTRNSRFPLSSYSPLSTFVLHILIPETWPKTQYSCQYLYATTASTLIFPLKLPKVFNIPPILQHYISRAFPTLSHQAPSPLALQLDPGFLQGSPYFQTFLLDYSTVFHQYPACLSCRSTLPLQRISLFSPRP